MRLRAGWDPRHRPGRRCAPPPGSRRPGRGSPSSAPAAADRPSPSPPTAPATRSPRSTSRTPEHARALAAAGRRRRRRVRGRRHAARRPHPPHRPRRPDHPGGGDDRGERRRARRPRARPLQRRPPGRRPRRRPPGRRRGGQPPSAAVAHRRRRRHQPAGSHFADRGRRAAAAGARAAGHRPRRDPLHRPRRRPGPLPRRRGARRQRPARPGGAGRPRSSRAPGSTPAIAGEALATLLEGAARNARRLGVRSALTGPVVRNDAETVDRHLEALRRDPDTLRALPRPRRRDPPHRRRHRPRGGGGGARGAAPHPPRRGAGGHGRRRARAPDRRALPPSAAEVPASGRAVTVRDLETCKREGRRFAVVTAYDYTTARILDAAGIPVLLVGDSLGMLMLGYSSTLPVSMDEMLHHARAVARGAPRKLLVGDMPFDAYHASDAEAVHNAAAFLKAGMNAVKIEGGGRVVGLAAPPRRARHPGDGPPRADPAVRQRLRRDAGPGAQRRRPPPHPRRRPRPPGRRRVLDRARGSAEGPRRRGDRGAAHPHRSGSARVRTATPRCSSSTTCSG